MVIYVCTSHVCLGYEAVSSCSDVLLEPSAVCVACTDIHVCACSSEAGSAHESVLASSIVPTVSWSCPAHCEWTVCSGIDTYVHTVAQSCNARQYCLLDSHSYMMGTYHSPRWTHAVTCHAWHRAVRSLRRLEQQSIG